MSRTRLVALDVDGTLMSYDGVISPQVRARVRELDEAGVHVVLSTGRAVHSAAEVALEWTRSGKGPIILEFLTYRYRGHSMSDPAKYRTREEVQDYREHHDPIDRAAKDLEAMGVKEVELKAIDKEIKDIVVEAAKFAEEAPEPEASELHTDVLVESY